MLKKFILLFLLTLPILAVQSQSFYLPVPDKWSTETFSFPIEFAPQISYSGEEYLRFSPFWGDTKSDELWSYCFLWWITADSRISQKSLENDLQSYYSGLVGRNIIRRKIDSALVVPTLTQFKEVKTEKGDGKTFEGTVKMLDYMGLRPVILQVTVHVIPCAIEGKIAVFFAVSPQPRSHPVWQQFKIVHEGFRCNK